MTITERLDRIALASGFDREQLRKNYCAWHLSIGPAKAEQLITDKEKQLRLRRAR
jgi:hypothetical protein